MTFQGCIRSKNHKNLKRLSVEVIEESEGVIEVRMVLLTNQIRQVADKELV
jgi:hypothetical protein